MIYAKLKKELDALDSFHSGCFAESIAQHIASHPHLTRQVKRDLRKLRRLALCRQLDKPTFLAPFQ